MAPKGKPVDWECETPADRNIVAAKILSAVRKSGDYAIDESSEGLVITRKYFPTWRILVLGLPAVIFGRRSEAASVRLEALTSSSTRVSVTGRLARWMRADLCRVLEGLGSTPADFASRKRAQVR
jgi:hypothetical protein